MLFPELDDFLQELDEDVEGMQSTILFLQQELKTSKETIASLEGELAQLKNVTDAGTAVDQSRPLTSDDQPGLTNGDGSHNDVTAPPPNGHKIILLPLASDRPLAAAAAAEPSDEHTKPIASERTLRKDRAASTTNSSSNPAKVAQAPRTLRSSSRHISSDDLRKVNTRNVRNGNTEVYDEVLDDELQEADEADAASTEAASVGDKLAADEVAPAYNGSANRKRSHDGDDSDSSEHGVAVDYTAAAGVDALGANLSSVINHKKFTKRVRQSPVSDVLDDEDGRIECDSERTLKEVANGNGGVAEA